MPLLWEEKQLKIKRLELWLAPCCKQLQEVKKAASSAGHQ